LFFLFPPRGPLKLFLFFLSLVVGGHEAPGRGRGRYVPQGEDSLLSPPFLFPTPTTVVSCIFSSSLRSLPEEERD